MVRMTVLSFAHFFILFWPYNQNMLVNRFHLPARWRLVISMIHIGTLGVAIHAIDGSGEEVQSGFESQTRTIFGCLCFTRLLIMIIYLKIMVSIPLSRPMVLHYVSGMGVVSLLFLIATIGNFIYDVNLGILLVAFVVEIAMYPLAYMVPKAQQLSADTGHLLERTQVCLFHRLRQYTL